MCSLILERRSKLQECWVIDRYFNYFNYSFRLNDRVIEFSNSKRRNKRQQAQLWKFCFNYSQKLQHVSQSLKFFPIFFKPARGIPGSRTYIRPPSAYSFTHPNSPNGRTDLSHPPLPCANIQIRRISFQRRQRPFFRPCWQIYWRNRWRMRGT